MAHSFYRQLVFLDLWATRADLKDSHAAFVQNVPVYGRRLKMFLQSNSKFKAMKQF